ncbi:hypothetical protein E4U42_007652, partial [Claviceps africana]
LTAAVWSIARDLKTHLAARTRTLPRDDPCALLKYVPDWFDYFRAKDGQPRPESWELSNIGVFHPPHLPPASPAPAFSFSSAYFTNGAMPVGPVLGVGMASVAGGGLTVGLSWHGGAVSEALMAGLVEDLERQPMNQDYPVLYKRPTPNATGLEGPFPYTTHSSSRVLYTDILCYYNCTI